MLLQRLCKLGRTSTERGAESECCLNGRNNVAESVDDADETDLVSWSCIRVPSRQERETEPEDLIDGADELVQGSGDIGRIKP